MENVRQIHTKDLLKWLIILGLPIFLLLIPVSDTFTWPIKVFLQ